MLQTQLVNQRVVIKHPLGEKDSKILVENPATYNSDPSLELNLGTRKVKVG